ncbi:lytic polysaccharide monooxygenase auxiliary activity family 9 protein [Silvanigrella aquatica]|uniref:Cell wall protein n=1 Tax=Silvanigrella aquatica TaxID=1915309 RepID=A0A1L4D1B7_9BACT|nr:lytic polysaccharide monooxygenase auxiliary activity family 9 protein [Silvanigrella aquatica]APJ03988.1 cell wall protein [Silvanigrella aquatica]
MKVRFLRKNAYQILFILLPHAVSLDAHAHGSMEYPVSRVYNCFLEDPENPKSDACKALVKTPFTTQPLYDWNGVNQGNVDGKHREVIPDGTLCGANNAMFSGLDLPRSDWVMTDISPNIENKMQFIYYATTPHATKYFEFYITKDSYDPKLPLKWSDLEEKPFCTVKDYEEINKKIKMSCPYPKGKTGRHVIYNIWQRSDSPEAFYACIDVNKVK